MKRNTMMLGFLLSLFSASGVLAQQTPVPRMVRFGGTVSKVPGKSSSSVVGITFALYKERQGGATLWIETQNVTLDSNGHYSVLLGSSREEGLPTDLFASGEARWLGVRVHGEQEQPRVLLLSVPYALKASDAETLGGLPPSAFALATPVGGSASQSAAASNPNAAAIPALAGGGTANFLPLWTNADTLGNSSLFQLAGKVGIGTNTPVSTLDVKGGATVRGALALPALGTATTAAGKNSEPLSLTASAFNSATGAPVSTKFTWQAETTANNTDSASGTLNLLFNAGTNPPAETGLKINRSGIINFAGGQTFPGTGTISGVTAGTGLVGGGTSGTLDLKLDLGFTDSRYAHLGSSNTFFGQQNIAGGGLAVLGMIDALRGLTVVGNSRNMVVGDPGCGSGFAGLGFTSDALARCNNYSLLGDSKNTYLNRPSGGFLTFREDNTDQMTLWPGGNVSLRNKIISYNGISTAGNGVPTIVSTYRQTGITFPDRVTLFTPAVEGLFRVSVYTHCAGTPTGGYFFGIFSTDPDPPNGSITVAPSPITCQGFSNHTLERQVFVLEAAANAPIGWATRIAPNFSSTGRYDVYVVLEQLF